MIETAPMFILLMSDALAFCYKISNAAFGKRDTARLRIPKVL